MQLTHRFATVRELEIYFAWANDEYVRNNSFNSAAIPFKQHVVWFNRMLLNADCFLYFFEADGKAAGQVRIEKSTQETTIGISVDANYRGMGLSHLMLLKATDDFKNKYSTLAITAYIKKENVSSFRAFSKAGFVLDHMTTIQDTISFKMVK